MNNDPSPLPHSSSPTHNIGYLYIKIQQQVHIHMGNNSEFVKVNLLLFHPLAVQRWRSAGPGRRRRPPLHPLERLRSSCGGRPGRRRLLWRHSQRQHRPNRTSCCARSVPTVCVCTCVRVCMCVKCKDLMLMCLWCNLEEFHADPNF